MIRPIIYLFTFDILLQLKQFVALGMNKTKNNPESVYLP